MRKRFDSTKPCSWCNNCPSSFCDCGPCKNLGCRTCHPCKDCKQVETGVEHCGIKEYMTDPCEACLEEAAIRNADNFGPAEKLIFMDEEDAAEVMKWFDEDSEGAGGDR